MLTKKQYELLLYIDDHLKRNGVSPSFDEMKDALRLKSKSGIHRLITALEERGFIRRLPNRARALEVLHLPEVPRAGMARGEFAPTVIEGKFRPNLTGATTPVARESESVELPLYGRIAAGTPIEAIPGHDKAAVPLDLIGPGEHYALQVAGDSMIDAGIFDGDTVIIQKAETAENGAIVVALVDDNEATLKRLRRKGASIALEPANPAHETRIFGPDRVRVQGKLVGLIRRY
jgi:repressor LexA